MANETRQKLVHLHTGEDRAPSASVLYYGEIAVMHNEDHPSLFIKAGENEATKVAQFIDKVQTEALIDQKISASTEDLIALKSEVLTEQGRINSLENEVITAMTVNGVDATLTPANLGNGNAASVTIDADDIEVGEAVTYSGDTFIAATASTKDALQELATKIQSIDGVVSESNHGHTNKAVLDGITAEKVTAWDQAATDDHTHSNKALLDTYTQTEADLADAVSKKHEHANASVLDGISAEDVTAWNGAVTALDGKVDKVAGKGLSTEDYTTAEKEKLATIAASAQTNVIETVKVNGTALTATDKAVDILVAEGTSNGTVKVNGVDIAVHGLGSAAYQDTTAFDASGAAATAKSEVIGTAGESANTLGKVADLINTLTTGSNVSISTATTTEGYLKSYTFSQNGSEIGTIDIPKDLVVTSGQVTLDDQNRKVLRLTIANQAEPVDILVSDLVDVYTEGNGIEISTGNVISAKVVAGNGLSVGANGIAMAAASASADGAMSSADFTKLAGIASGAQVNVLEGVQVNGADLTPDANKKVNVTITAGTNNGTISVNGSDVAVTGLGSAAYANTTAFDAAGAADTVKTDLIGTMSGSTKTLGALQDAIVAVEGGLGTAAAADVEDFDAAGAAAAASGAAVTAVVGDASASGSTLGALEDRMDNMDLGEHNVLEGVQVNGSDLSISNKKVNVTVAEGATDGTIAVNGTDVAVHGLGSAAYAATTDFDAAGAAGAASAAAVSTVVGTAQDNSGATTVYGAKAYADQKASDAQAAAEAAVVGTTGDTSGATTVYGAKAYADQVAAEAQAAAEGAVQGIESGKESGAQLNASNELDFSGFGIDCGTY